MYNFLMRLSNIAAGLMFVAAIVLSWSGLRPWIFAHPELPRATIQAGLAAPLATVTSRSIEELTQRTANTLATVDAPMRDLVSLTERLRLSGDESVPAMVNSTPPNYQPGSRQQFYVADVTTKGYFTITASIRIVTPHAYWYVKDDYAVDDAALRTAADYFESHIYPTDRRVFGPEVDPGVDNDGHITVLLAPVPGVSGYFSSSDAYPTIVNPFSNERDIIYMSNLPSGDPGAFDNYFAGTLAHEFQHMIHWNRQRNRDVWLDEGCSELAMSINGYSVAGTDAAFTSDPDVQLNAWGDPSSSFAHYGAAYLFLSYLRERYGGDRFIYDLLGQDRPGTGAVDAQVKAAGNPAGFDGAFEDWTVANVLDDDSLDGGRYSYSEAGRVQPGTQITNYPARYSASLHQYAADYVALSGADSAGAATLVFTGSNTVPVIAAEPHSGQAYWYANRRDSGDATLTREFDLTHSREAHLNFWTWYDTENTFDYAYVEASTDSGRSWLPLKGAYTTTQNPNGTAYGPGWTGKSGTSTDGNANAQWVQESIDLSAYAGKEPEVRFEYVTDEGYNRPGFAIDDISVPEIGYSDDAETDNGWTAEGFVRIGSHMPQKWFVALIEPGIPYIIREMAVDSDGKGALQLDGLGDTKAQSSAILVVAPLAPKTTEEASYSIAVVPNK